MEKQITVAHFSPTGGTRRAALALAKGLAEESKEWDLSRLKGETPAFSGEELVLFAAPVFGGRIPEVLLRTLNTLRGNGARAVTAVVYGNRDFDDALLELNKAVKENGFTIVASAALVAQHSLAPAVGAGRPDPEDCFQMKGFAQRILEKLEQGGGEPSVPGNPDFLPRKPGAAVPETSGACVRCGACARNCPVGAIPLERPETTDPAKCILCMRCVNLCTKKARSLPAAMAAGVAAKLAPCLEVRRENELFL